MTHPVPSWLFLLEAQHTLVEGKQQQRGVALPGNSPRLEWPGLVRRWFVRNMLSWLRCCDGATDFGVAHLQGVGCTNSKNFAASSRHHACSAE